MTAREPPGWYETNLSARERKRRGHFSTPPQLVEQILDACGYTPDHDLSHLRVLDPACGSGNFLTGAAARLLACAQRAGLNEREQIRLLQRNIWGFDLDPVACFLTEMQLQHTLTLARNAGVEEGQAHHESGNRRRTHYPRRLHIHLADGLTFPWHTCENVDLFLANPPYLATKNTDLSGYLATRQHGQADSYQFFLRLALQIVRPGGWIGLILPDAVLARAGAAPERRQLLAQTTVHHLWHLSNVFKAYVGAVVIIAQKHPPTSTHQITWRRGQWLHTPAAPTRNEAIVQARRTYASVAVTHENTIAQELLRQQPRTELCYLLSEAQGTLIEALHTYTTRQQLHETTRPLVALSDCVRIRRGEEIAKKSTLLSTTRPAGHATDNTTRAWYPVLRGGVDIRPYSSPLTGGWLPAHAIHKPLERYQAPKLLVIKSAGRLQATLDLQGHVVLQTLYMLHLQEQRPALWEGDTCTAGDYKDALYFLLALLNSRLLQDYIYILYTAYKWIQPQIEQHVLAHLPLPTVATWAEKERIVQLARELRHTCDRMASAIELNNQNVPSRNLQERYNSLYEEQEQMLCSLYTRALEQGSVEQRAGAGERAEAAISTRHLFHYEAESGVVPFCLTQEGMVAIEKHSSADSL